MAREFTSVDLEHVVQEIRSMFSSHEQLLLEILHRTRLGGDMPGTEREQSGTGSFNGGHGLKDYEAMGRINTTRSRRSKRLSQMGRDLRERAENKVRGRPDSDVGESGVSVGVSVGILKQLRIFLRRIFEHQVTGYAILLLIFSNVILVAVEAEVNSKLPANEIPAAFDVCNYLYTCLFALELSLKLFAYGPMVYFCGPDAWWNIVDFCIVMFSVAELALVEGMSLGHLRIFRLLRAMKILRALRVVRVLRFVASLRNLLVSIAHTIKTLFWALALIFLNLFGVGIAMTQASAEFCRDESGDLDAPPDCSDPKLNEFWADLSTSMLSLFMAISGGISWYEVMRPLFQVGWLVVALFLSYVTFMIFCVLNVVTGVFCQVAIDSAATDKDTAIMMHMHNKELYLQSFKKVFKEIDHDGSDVITLDELEGKLQDESLALFFDSINVDTQDAWLLFTLIDEDQSGCIDMEEFLTGCLQLKGHAKAIHLASVMHDNRVIKQSIDHLEDTIVAFQDDVVRQRSEDATMLATLKDATLGALQAARHDTTGPVEQMFHV
eukprot:TRINITY_DN107359_c0_g1_i1.p1 TRINITY_DN107359_c0_g1~~TRINITY_DN107359_c0_g1_i1.p1  ORF type:complete len:561 (+),score=89.48 TRINITY_DN107359_c0_g1_i1:32-1684(+)